jgi:rhodanese-related sulfurtransferase
MAGAIVLFVFALGVVAIGSPTLEEKYSKLSFTRTETIPQLNDNPIVNKVTYTADQMLEERLVQVTPAELFKTRYNQNVSLIMLDVRSEPDYNLYHINGAINVPLDKLESMTPDLLSEPPANSVFVVMSNDEEAATQAWKQLAASSVPNVYILEGGIHNWIKVFGKDEGFQAVASPIKDQLGYIFPAALGSQYASCDPDPVENEKLDFESRIKLELKRDKSGGGCG